MAEHFRIPAAARRAIVYNFGNDEIEDFFAEKAEERAEEAQEEAFWAQEEKETSPYDLGYGYDNADYGYDNADYDYGYDYDYIWNALVEDLFREEEAAIAAGFAALEAEEQAELAEAEEEVEDIDIDFEKPGAARHANRRRKAWLVKKQVGVPTLKEDRKADRTVRASRLYEEEPPLNVCNLLERYAHKDMVGDMKSRHAKATYQGGTQPIDTEIIQISGKTRFLPGQPEYKEEWLKRSFQNYWPKEEAKTNMRMLLIAALLDGCECLHKKA